MHTPDIRTFNSHDWDCWAGAEKFDDGAEPLIVNELDWILLADGNGIEVDFEDRVYQVNKVTHPETLAPFWDQELARLILLNLSKKWSRMTTKDIMNYCEDHGFVCVLG